MHSMLNEEKTGFESICKIPDTLTNLIIRLKCFTFGKRLKRNIDPENAVVSRVALLKKKFERLGLLREFYSVKTKNNFRKFRFPVNEIASRLKGNSSMYFDELQYCEESDVEELSPLKRSKSVL